MADPTAGAESFASGESFASTSGRWRQCMHSFVGCPEASFADRNAADVSSSANDADGENNPDGPRFYVKVDDFRVGSPSVFIMTVRRGDAVWQIKRRFRQVWAVHTSLTEGLGRNARILPRPPPRATFRSATMGQQNRQFLHQRGQSIERYLEALLNVIPCVYQCEALYKFLCYNSNLRSWEYGTMIGGGAPPVAATAIKNLPRKDSLLSPRKNMDDKVAPNMDFKTSASAPQFCVVCQESMKSDVEDIRVLPCGHEFHFKCISSWLSQRNTCCICQGSAVPTAPRFE